MISITKMVKFITRKFIKETGNQLAITFTKDEKEAYNLNKDQLIEIRINTKIRKLKK